MTNRTNRRRFIEEATLVGQPLEFDPRTCRIEGNPEADRALRPQHREGWTL